MLYFSVRFYRLKMIWKVWVFLEFDAWSIPYLTTPSSCNLILYEKLCQKKLRNVVEILNFICTLLCMQMQNVHWTYIYSYACVSYQDQSVTPDLGTKSYLGSSIFWSTHL